MALIEIYPPPRSKDYKSVKTVCGQDDEKEKCCGTTFLCKKVIAAFILFVALPVLIFFTFAIVPIRYNRRPVPALTTLPSKTTGVIRVLLVGDSVLGLPSRKTSLVTKIGQLLPQYFMTVAVSGKLGVKMFVLRSRIDKILRADKPDVVILYSDSDLSNSNEDVLTQAQKYRVRSEYRANYTSIVETILATKAKLAISGPGLLGEGPLFQIPNPARFVNKQGMLDDYCTIAKEIASKYEVPYLDIRGELKKAIPWWRLWYAGYVTKDGEHTNERGSQLLAKMIAEQLLQWFEGYNSTTHFTNYSSPATPQLSYILDDQTY